MLAIDIFMFLVLGLAGNSDLGIEIPIRNWTILAIFMLLTFLQMKHIENIERKERKMIEKYNNILKECNLKRLEKQCEEEDLAKEILFYSTDKSEEEQNERQKFLNRKLEQRKNLYIYPEKVNV